jgi:hypothetical protein
MWGLLRIILLVVNAVFFARIGYLCITNPPVEGDVEGYLLVYGLLVVLAFNFVYLSKGSNWRIPRLIGLWFDAKKSVLRQRADRSRQDG